LVQDTEQPSEKKKGRSLSLNANEVNELRNYLLHRNKNKNYGKFFNQNRPPEIAGGFRDKPQRKTETKRCLIIPVDESGLFVGEKGVYLNMTAIEMENPKFSETHCVKSHLTKRSLKP
jgi:hypothetical protein